MCQNQRPNVVLVEKHNLSGDVFYTTPLFWDCECERDYIHPCTEPLCPICKVERDDAPNARVDEVFRSGGLDTRLLAALEALCEEVCPDLMSVPF